MRDPPKYPYHDADHGGVYSVPRRFDLATMMVVTAGYALLFTLLRLLNLDTVVFVYVAGLVTTVAVAQALSHKRYSPRAVSVLTGMCYFLAFLIPLTWLEATEYRREQIYSMICCSSGFGPIQGYLAGVLVAGVFMVSDYLRRFLGSHRFLSLRPPKQGAPADQSPWDEETGD